MHTICRGGSTRKRYGEGGVLSGNSTINRITWDGRKTIAEGAEGEEIGTRRADEIGTRRADER